MSFPAELLPLLMVPVFAFVIWAIFELFTWCIKPRGSSCSEELMFPGMANGQVIKRKRLLSLYEIYSPHDGHNNTPSQTPAALAKAVEANLKVVSVPPNVVTIQEEDDLPPTYGKSELPPPMYDEVVLSIDNLANQTLTPRENVDGQGQVQSSDQQHLETIRNNCSR